MDPLERGDKISVVLHRYGTEMMYEVAANIMKYWNQVFH